VRALAGEREIAATTLNIPHPYAAGMAEAWISQHAAAFDARELATFAVITAGDGALIGAVGLAINATHARAELGYWIGAPYWNQGYATEAAREVLRFGFQDLELHRIQATHLARNPASGRVMQKIGMRREGRLRGHFIKWGSFEDVEIYGILADDWRAAAAAADASRA
jgi:[ribosomal protein S5]-alanine N-acetyltransferase